MRRTKGGFLHPALRMKLGEQGLERLVGDAAGVRRVSEPGGRLDYLPVEPDLDITSYHEQIDFKDDRDVDTTDIWRETGLNDISGERLKVLDWGGSDQPHARIKTGKRQYDYFQYQRRNLNYYPTTDSSNDIWFLTRVKRTARDGDVYLGYAELGDRDNGYGLFYDTDSNRWTFRIDYTNDSGQHANAFDIAEGTSNWADLSLRIRYEDGAAIVEAKVNAITKIFVFEPELVDGTPLFDIPLHLTMAIHNPTDGNTAGLELQFLKTISSK